MMISVIEKMLEGNDLLISHTCNLFLVRNSFVLFTQETRSEGLRLYVYVFSRKLEDNLKVIEICYSFLIKYIEGFQSPSLF